MSELRTFIVAPILALLHVPVFSDDAIADMLDKAERLGFNICEPGSPLEDLTLGELEILVQDSGRAS